ncbi:hypothetical protein L0Y59_02080 [Candidatus Uhrbacteria bacterium]|nr:hypothetical protein [Candidatus Uhrbacteria bacterium]
MTYRPEQPRDASEQESSMRSPEERDGRAIFESATQVVAGMQGDKLGVDRTLETVERSAAAARIPDDERRTIREQAASELDRVAREMVAVQNRTRGAVRSVLSRWAKNPLVRMAAISAALHTPLTPMYRDAYDAMFPDKPDTVLRPQSYDAMLATSARVAEREGHIVPERVNAYKEEIRDRFKRGEPVSFRELYLDMERLNGVDADKVARAKTAAAKRAEAFAARFGNDLDRAELVQFVGEMYGDPSNYDWGQASVTEYFETGKRNCVAIAKAELVVLEGIIDRLPPDARARYELGINKMKQHEVATLTDRQSGETFLLEGFVESLKGTKEVTGTKTIDIQTLKKGIVAEKPIEVAAKEGEVEKSPDLFVLTNQPVYDGIEVTGPLSGSEYVVQEAKRQGFEPEVATAPDNINDAIEIEVLKEGEEGKKVLDATIAELQEDFARGNQLPRRPLNLSTLKNPTPEDIKAALPSDSLIPSIPYIEAGDLSDWPEQSVVELMDTKVPEVMVTSYVEKMGNVGIRRIPDILIRSLQEREFLTSLDEPSPRPTYIQELTVGMGFGMQPKDVNGVPSEDVRQLLQAAKDIPRVNLDVPIFPEDDVGAMLINAPQKELRVMRSVFSPTNIVMMGESGKTFYLDAYGYLELIKDIPEALKYPNIRWDCNLGVSAVNELVDVLRSKLPPNDRRRLDAERVAKEQLEPWGPLIIRADAKGHVDRDAIVSFLNTPSNPSRNLIVELDSYSSDTMHQLPDGPYTVKFRHFNIDNVHRQEEAFLQRMASRYDPDKIFMFPNAKVIIPIRSYLEAVTKYPKLNRIPILEPDLDGADFESILYILEAKRKIHDEHAVRHYENELHRRFPEMKY